MYSSINSCRWLCAPKFVGGLVLLLCLSAVNLAKAHDPGLSVANVTRNGESISIQLGMSGSDAERLVNIDANHDGRISDSEFQAALPQLKAIAHEAFQVMASIQTLAPANTVVTLDSNNGIQFQISYPGKADGSLTVRSLLLEKLPRGHRQFISFRGEDKQLLGEQMLDVTRAEFTAQLPEVTSPPAASHSFREFLTLGVEHILTGYDHLLFLLGLLIIGGSLRTALQIITSFTVAHSITLALATMNVINIPPRIIEPLIAASIVFVGAQNLFNPKVDKRWLLTFGFGLIHGCGFASALRDLGIGANGGGIAVPLLSFNLGVELGQLSIAAVVLPIIWKCQKSPIFVRRLVPVASVFIVIAGGYWLIERTLL